MESGFGAYPGGIGVDSSDDLYLIAGFGSLEQFSSSGGFIGQVTDDQNPGPITGMAVDPTTGDVFADDGGGLIRHYTAANVSSCAPSFNCAADDTFGHSDLSGAQGLAIDASTGSVFAADTGDQRVDVFTGPVTLPDVSTGQASSVTGVAATLNGTVNPDSTSITDCHFEYIADSSYNPSAADPYPAGGGTSSACSSTPSGSTPVPVTANLPDLFNGTTYDYRLDASSSNGQNTGQNEQFTTVAPPSIDSAAAQNLTATTAELTAQINPNLGDTTYHMEYGRRTVRQQPVHQHPDPGRRHRRWLTTDVAVTQPITGLTQNTEYHWRIIATNIAGATTSVDHTFISDAPAKDSPTAGPTRWSPPTTKTAPRSATRRRPNRPRSLPDGSRVIAMASQCFADAGACRGVRDGGGEPYEFTRSASGWVTNSLSPSEVQFPDSAATWGFNADAGTALFSIPTAPALEDDFYARQPDGSFTRHRPIHPSGEWPEP